MPWYSTLDRRLHWIPEVNNIGIQGREITSVILDEMTNFPTQPPGTAERLDVVREEWTAMYQQNPIATEPRQLSNEVTTQSERLMNDEEFYPFYYERPSKMNEDIQYTKPAPAIFGIGPTPIRPGKSFIYELMILDGYATPKHTYLLRKPYTAYCDMFSNDGLSHEQITTYAKTPLSQSTVWHYDALEKITNGFWTPCVLNKQAFYYNSEHKFMHYLHISRKHPNQVAYTPSNDYGTRGREIRVKPGRYLAKFFGDVLTAREIKHYTMMFQDKHGAELEEIHYATTEDDIENVYETGPNSCMVYDREERYIESDIHPVRVYNSPDLAIAYVKTARGSVKQRTVCNMVEKQYTVVYGEGNLSTMLRDRGFTCGNIHGCRIKKITDNNGDHLMPYLDGDTYVKEHDANYWMAGDTGIECTSTDGWLHDHRTQCADCSDRYDDDDMSHVGVRNARIVCDSCSENYRPIETHYGLRYIADHDVITVYLSTDQEIEKEIWDGDVDEYEWDEDTSAYYSHDAYNYLIELREREEEELLTNNTEVTHVA